MTFWTRDNVNWKVDCEVNDQTREWIYAKVDSAVNGGGMYNLLWWFVSSLLVITFVFTLVSFLFIYLNWREGHERLHKGVRDGMVFFMVLQALNLAIMWPYMDMIANDPEHIENRVNDLAVMNGCSD